jgi:hypothetical protein
MSEEGKKILGMIAFTLALWAAIAGVLFYWDGVAS